VVDNSIQATKNDKHGDMTFESEMWIWLKCTWIMLCIHYEVRMDKKLGMDAQ
jgi:hypothetical protein